MKPYFIKSLHLTVTLILCTVCSFGQGNEEDGTVDVQYLTAAMTGVLNHHNGSADTTTPNTPTLTKLTIESNTTTLNVGEKARLNIIATYQDNTTKSISKGITYIVTPKDHADINGMLLSAHKDGNLTVQAKVGNTLSNTITLGIYWEVDGHRLPPEPDPAVNNATLLGVDVNHNGVRDDVERWIYQHYDHPIERGIMLQSARAYQKVIVDPKKAHETVKYSNNTLSCSFYYIHNHFLDRYRNSHNRKNLKKIEFNTLQRYIAYQKYNSEFNGEVLSSPKASKEKCEFDKYGNLKDEK